MWHKAFEHQMFGDSEFLIYSYKELTCQIKLYDQQELKKTKKKQKRNVHNNIPFPPTY